MFINSIELSQATGEVRTMYDRQSMAWGHLPNYARPFSHRPEVMFAWSGLLSVIKRNLGARRFELATFAAAVAMRSSYCSLAHYQALAGLLDEAEHAWLIRREGKCPFTAAETALLEFVGKMVQAPDRVTRDDVDHLKMCGFSDTEIFDITAAASARMFFASLLDGLGVHADSRFNELGTTVLKALVSGRAIDPQVESDKGDRPWT
jgi:uncharacterized peroxidase-related enzyme